eukprot:10930893-Ditylum_brightwellii.AAC.1
MYHQLGLPRLHMLQSRENVHILRMLEGLPQQDRTTSHGGGLSGGPAGLPCSRTESGAGPLHHSDAGCNRQGHINGGWAEEQRSRNQALGVGAEEEQSQVEKEAHAQPLLLPSSQGEDFWPLTLEALLLGDSPQEGET